MQILKESIRSLCPACGQPASARAVLANGQVELHHGCPDHATEPAPVESDPDFYLDLVSDKRRPGASLSPHASDYLTIFPTYRCNMNCRVCYVPRRDRSLDCSLDELAEWLDQWPHDQVWYAGGEPTVLKELDQVLALTRSKGKDAFIVSNGIRLADRAYVDHLVKAGLTGVSLSLNGLDAVVLEAVDGRDCLAEKRRAVTNLKRARVRFALCFTLVPGVNDAEFGKVLWFALKNYPLARSFHAECLPGVGRELSPRRTFLSGMVDRLAGELGLRRADFQAAADAGRAQLGLYGMSFDIRDLGLRPFLASLRHAPLATGGLVLTRLLRLRWPDFRIRVLTGPLADTVDLDQTWSAEWSMAISRESPLMPLWRYFLQYHPSGKTADQARVETEG